MTDASSAHKTVLLKILPQPRQLVLKEISFKSVGAMGAGGSGQLILICNLIN